MPGKHAPDSPTSFYLSIARAVTGALAALALVVAIAMVAVNSRANDEPRAAGTPAASSPTELSSVEESPTPEPSESEPEPSVAEPVRAPAKTSVDVLNGTPRAGLARSLADRIAGKDYKIATVGNAARAAKTTIFYRKDAKAEAEALLRAFPELKRIREASGSTPGSALLTVVIGDNYKP
jgi:hypothetical protein